MRVSIELRRLAALGAVACALAACATAPAPMMGPITADGRIDVTGDPATAGFDPAVLAAEAAAVQADIDAGVIPGAVMLVGRDNEVIWYETLGQQGPNDPTPMNEQTIFRVYSMTKPIVSFATMSMVEDGLIALDDPVSDYIPSYASLTVLVGDGEVRPATTEMTVKHLLTHTSGLIYGVFSPDTELGEMYLDAGSSSTSITARSLADILANLPLRTDPGAAWFYSRSTDVLGAVLEAAAGQDLQTILDERVLDPLGMDDTAFYLPASKSGQMAQAYEEGLIDPFTPMPMMSGGGGLVSSTEDYLRFVLMQMNGGEWNGVRIVEPETFELMMTGVLDDSVDASDYFYDQAGGDFGLGLGLIPVDLEDPYSPTSAGWGGYAGTLYWTDETNDVFGLYMIQNSEADTLRGRFKASVYEALED
ncbi:MAG: serine hydrolase domain-containing protein [Maricaulaceae bacterium]